MTQLDINDLTMFYSALHLPLPKAPKSIDEKTFRIEILVKEFSQYQEPKISELTLFPTEMDLWLPPLLESEQKEQLTFAHMREKIHY